MQKLGHTIRTIRKQKGMTLKSLAASTNLSVGFISKIERDINSPSFNNLQKICFALGVTANELVDAPLKEQDGMLLVRKNERTMVYDYSNAVCCESVFSNSRHFALDVMTLKGSNKEYTTSQHTHDEFCIVAKGCMVVIVDGQKHIIEEGDAIMLRANVKHHVQKACDGPCIYHLIKTYDEK